MRRRRTGAGLAWLLGVSCVVLGWVIYVEVANRSVGEVADPASVMPPSPLTPAPAQPMLAMPGSASFAVILERPVFSATRRPSGIASAGPQSAPIDFTLSGVVISGGQRSALIRISKGDVVQRLTEGEDIAGWKLVEIASDRIVVRRGTVEADVFLDYGASAPSVPGTQNLKEKPTAPASPEKPAENTANQPADAAGPPEE